MTQIAAICHSLLNGETLTIMSGFKKFFCTNLPRELSRSVEQKFGVRIDKTPVKFTSTYGQSGIYFKYKLLKTPENKEGIEKIREYISENMKEYRPKEKPKPLQSQSDLFAE